MSQTKNKNKTKNKIKKQSRIESIREIRVGIDFGESNFGESNKNRSTKNHNGNKIHVIPVGRLAIRDSQIYFEYDSKFIKKGLEISPFRLPLKSGLIHFKDDLFEGLPGVFNDSLPDGWGRLLFDRLLRSRGVSPDSATPLDRLAYIGQNGLGALVFEPDYGMNEIENEVKLDELAGQAQEVLDGLPSDVLEKLTTINGSLAGARSKAMIGLDKSRNHIIHGVYGLPEGYTPWIVKFANRQDGPDAGAMEYVYALMAKEAGISMPEVHLFSAQEGAGYFATKRFDCDYSQGYQKKRYHVHTVCGLLHTDFRAPSLDYEILMALAEVLTRDIREVEKMYQLAVFNVLSHNRDDHSKNFSFLMDQHGKWKLSPGYDLTFSSGPAGEQSTMVMGEGRHPTINHLIRLGEKANLKKERVNEIIEATCSSLSKWSTLAKEYGVSKENTQLIEKHLNHLLVT